ncbi:hypothetical protein ACOSQ2_005229 [Xanthoceras sorbifolium]
MFGSTSTLLENLINKGLNNNMHGETKGISDMFCQALQLKSQDILNAMNLMSTTKMLLLEYEMDIPNINARYLKGTKRSCQQKDNVTI